MQYIDTHTHIDGEEFKDDLDEVVARAKAAGAIQLLVPGINYDSIASIKAVCERFPDFMRPMIGLHPEDVKEDYEIDFFMETSAKTGLNIQELFVKAAKVLFEDYSDYKKEKRSGSYSFRIKKKECEESCKKKEECRND